VQRLRGFNHWFLHSCTFPSCLPDPGRLAVTTRPVVVRAAPTFPCASRVRLPSASPPCCDRQVVGSFHPHRVSQRLTAHSMVAAEYGTPPEIAGNAGAGVGLYVLTWPMAVH
jgi:hypothetical protein